MKISKLFVLTALSLSASSAMAAIVDGVRQKPTVPQTFTEFALSDTVYLYNVGADKFFCGANDYSTRASVGEKGHKIAFVEIEGGVLFRDSAEAKSAWKGVSVAEAAGDNGIWVDQPDWTYRFWNVTKVGDAYRIENATKTEIKGMFLGWNGHADDTRLYFFAADELGDTAKIDWKFMKPEVYTAYETAVSVYLKAQELKGYLDEAKAKNLDVAAQETIYLNESATMEQIEAAITAVKDIIKNAAQNDATVENPGDMTTSIANPNFDGASSAGWKGSSPGWGNGNQSNSEVAEFYNTTYDIYQELEDMPAGVYALSATAFYRGSYDDFVNKTNRNGYLYAEADGNTMTQTIANPWEAMNKSSMAGNTDFGSTAGETSQEINGDTYYIPNDPSAARLYFEAGFYKSSLFFGADNGKVKLGLKKTVSVTNDWTVFDNFKLMYYGNKPEAYQFWLTSALNASTSYDDVVCTASYLEAYNNAVKGATATNKEQVLAALAAVKAVEDTLLVNIDLWKQLAAKNSEAQEVSTNPNIDTDYKDELDDMLGDYKKWVQALALTNDQIRAKIVEFDEVIAETMRHLTPGSDCTNYMKNADFEKRAEGWTGNPGIGTGGGNTCAEAYGKDFDIYQEVKGAPVGVYEIQVQSFFRLGRPQHENSAQNDPEINAWTLYEQGKQVAPAFVYMNQAQTPLKCIYEEGAPNGLLPKVNEGDEDAYYTAKDIDEPGDGNQYPNTMTQAAEAFAHGMYKASAFGLVAKDGDVMRVGVKGKLLTNDGNVGKGANWAIFDNFKLTFRGFQADVVLASLQNALTELNAYADKKMGKDAKAALDGVAQAFVAVDKEDGKAMFDVLVKTFEVTEQVQTSIALFEQLIADNTSMSELIDGAPCDDDVKLEAAALNDELNRKIQNGELTDEQAQAAIKQIAEMVTKLNTDPIYKTATDENPVDMTSLLKSPGFEKIDGDTKVNSAEGWTVEKGTMKGITNGQKEAFAAEFYDETFNVYQDIVGLPNGTYKVSAKSFCRVGSIANDYEKWQANAKATEAFLYAVSADECSTPVPCLFTGALETNPEITGQSTYEKDGKTFYIPNSMVSAVAFFDLGYYDVSLIVKVTDNKLTVGMKKNENSSTGWVIMDDYKLTYYGENSAQQQNDNPLVIEDVNARGAQVGFYTLDGRKTNAAQKGIFIQKTVLDNGKVVVRKIQK